MGAFLKLEWGMTLYHDSAQVITKVVRHYVVRASKRQSGIQSDVELNKMIDEIFDILREFIFSSPKNVLFTNIQSFPVNF